MIELTGGGGDNGVGMLGATQEERRKTFKLEFVR